MTNNILPTQQVVSANPTEIEVDDLFEQLRERKYRITAEYSANGTLLKVCGELPEKKSKWDIFQIVIIPLLIVLITIAVGLFQNNANNSLAKQQHDSDQRVAQQQRAVDQNISHETQQQVILKTYLDDMSNLLLSSQIVMPQLLQANKNDEIRKVAQAKTQIALESLDNQYKADVMTFLYRAGLVDWHNLTSTSISNANAFPLVNLDFDNFNGIDMTAFYMTNVDISDIYMNDAQMNNAILTYDNISKSFLQRAHLRFATLHGVDLSLTDLTGADLSGAYLNCDSIRVAPNVVVMDVGKLNICPTLSHTTFIHALLKGADMKGDDLSSADLTSADLSNADLSCNILQGSSYCVNLRGVDLKSTILNGADLSGANLQGAKVDMKHLEKVAKSLHGTILPDGTVHA